jgi:hypothetical protein
MSNFRKEYKTQLLEHFDNNNIPYDSEIIKSIMSKVSIHSRNKYGEVSFEDELFECGIDNGLFFYDEYKKEDTFNNRNKQN